MKAPFIVLEGIGGSGKSTARKVIADFCRVLGHDPIETREPGGTPAAEYLRGLLRGGLPGVEPEAALDPVGVALVFNAARIDHVNKVIAPALAKGQVVICDRFCDSTFAYQSVFNGVSLQLLVKLHELVVGKYPTMTFVLDCPAEVAAARLSSEEKSADQFDRASLAQQEAMRQLYLQLAAQNPHRYVVIDASRSAHEVEKQILEALPFLVEVDGSILTKPVGSRCKGNCGGCAKKSVAGNPIPVEEQTTAYGSLKV